MVEQIGPYTPVSEQEGLQTVPNNHSNSTMADEVCQKDDETNKKQGGKRHGNDFLLATGEDS